jgi:hypothetical protein
MTFVRRKALEISSWVTWLASPGCKEWAEGLEREVAFIASDWRSLGWAIGSVRVLLEPRLAPIRSIEQVQAAAKKYFDDRRAGIAVTYFFCFLLAALISVAVYTLLSVDRYPLDRLSACLMTGAVAFLCYRTRLFGRVEIHHPEDLYDCTRYFRSELKRDIDFQSGWASCVCFAALISGFLLQGYGAYGTVLGSVRGDLLPFILILIPLIQIRMYRRKLQRRMDELDALMERGSEGAAL